jgi:GNAT superfamily N-acetyltransferase
MPLTFAMDPPVTADLRTALLDLWTDVTAAGGAVGFPQGTAREVIEPYANAALNLVAADQAVLIAGYETDGAAAGRLTAVAFLDSNDPEIFRHWRMVKRVMVHPDAQGRGYGSVLMREVERRARAVGLQFVLLTCRGGTGVDDFYAKHGYVECGRVRRGIRLSADDYRDEIQMMLDLTLPAPTA